MKSEEKKNSKQAEDEEESENKNGERISLF